MCACTPLFQFSLNTRRVPLLASKTGPVSNVWVKSFTVPNNEKIMNCWKRWDEEQVTLLFICSARLCDRRWQRVGHGQTHQPPPKHICKNLTEVLYLNEQQCFLKQDWKSIKLIFKDRRTTLVGWNTRQMSNRETAELQFQWNQSAS